MEKKNKENLQLEELQRRFEMVAKDLAQIQQDASRLFDGTIVELTDNAEVYRYENGYYPPLEDRLVNVCFVWFDKLEFPIEVKSANRTYTINLSCVVRIVE